MSDNGKPATGDEEPTAPYKAPNRPIPHDEPAEGGDDAPAGDQGSPQG